MSNYNTMKKAELIEYAAIHGIEIDAKAKKSEIIETLEAHEEPVATSNVASNVVSDGTNHNTINNSKEEKKMTEIKNGRTVSKNGTAEETKAPKLSAKERMRQAFKNNPELANVKIDQTATSEDPLASESNLGRHDDYTFKGLESKVVKYKGNPALNQAPAFKIKLVYTTNVRPIYLTDGYYMFRDGERVENIDVFYAIPEHIFNATGYGGVYFTVKEKALENKSEKDFDLLEDCDMHQLKENETIFMPMKDEIKKIKEILQISEIEVTDDDSIVGWKAKLPEFTAPLYVYEDMPAKDAKPVTKMTARGKIVEEPRKPFYKVSFKSPEEFDYFDKDGAPVQKYENFTTDRNVARLKKLSTLPHVIEYLEKLQAAATK